MKRFVADIRREIAERPVRSAWDKGCREYAIELFDEIVENRKLTDKDELGKEITEKEQLNGASDWSQYSFGGCALVYDGDICERLCTPKEAERLKYGERKPTLYPSWLDAQAAALKQAARMVRLTANRRSWHG